jgi:hypothetical protein
MDICIVPSTLLFKWNEKFYHIVRAGITDNVAYAETEPKEAALEASLADRIQKDHGLKVYLAPGYVCFIDDYGK